MACVPRLTDPNSSSHHQAKILRYHAIGDGVVPISTGSHLANAMNLLGRTLNEWKPRLQDLKRWGVLDAMKIDEEGNFDPDGTLFDVDDLTQDQPITQPQIGPFPPIKVLDGISVMRFADFICS